MTEQFDPIAVLLGNVVQELRGLRADLRRQQSHSGTPSATAALLQAIFETTGGHQFLASDLLMDADMPDSHLRDALKETTGLNSKRIGQFLASVEGDGLDGLVVRRVRSTRDGFMWSVVKM